ncbi:MAG: SusC/RagA family TonB-linked outer membrane protein [Gemmatimonadaceae bacterium]|nr:SusC/RagA family TonB-linked outer membrane protein [Gemmatimonadaceae bacterium]NUQ94927.1 SusC/RagA family TonB-linked outer membrane protein [Gemmatimonadaceae bacterium]NUR18700.1 SusC/RagA family TonB-linked outer membrane protein [Gemmatimonadaceae bacterium]
MRQVSRWMAACLLLASLPAIAGAQGAGGTRRVTGRVTEQGNDRPLAAATVQVVGTAFGTTTTDDGSFAVVAPEGDVTLRVRRIGFKAREVAVPAGQQSADVALQQDVLQLETQVVTGQATTISSRNAANAVAVVSADQLNRAPAQTVDNALQGKIPGAVISQNSGAPGGGTQVMIRGVNTVNGQYQPLYVIDGVIVNNDAFPNGLNAISGAGVATSAQVAAAGGVGQQGSTIVSTQDQQVNRIADLNPNDIESVEVLKGPSAGAIYGSKGANGVIIITTKQGKAGRPTLDFTQRVGTQQLAKKYDLRCFSQSEAAAYIDAHATGFGFTSAQYFADHRYAGCQDPQEQLFSGDGVSYESAGSLRGGVGTGSYMLSGSAKRDQGLMRNTGYSKQGLRANLSQSLGSRVVLRGSAEILHTLTERGISGNDNTTINPITIISATPTFFDFATKDPTTGDYARNPWLGNGGNVLQEAAQVRTPENVYRGIGSLQGSLQLWSSQRQTLELQAVGGFDTFSDDGRVYSPPTTYIEQSGAISPFPGTIVNSKASVQNANVNLSGTHHLIFSPATFTTSAGLRQERAQADFVTNLGQGLFPGITNFAGATQTAASDGQVLTKTFSYYAQEELLALDEALLLTAAINAERASTNGDPRKFYTFPKYAASYRLPFAIPATDNFKVRLAYGKAGNRVPTNFKYTFLQNQPYAGVVGLRPAAIVGLEDIKPEVTTETEGGFDAQFLDGRAGLELTLYRKTTRDLVLQAGVSPATGFTTVTVNGGALRNSGTEIGLRLAPLSSSSRVQWTSFTTYAANRSLVTELPVAPFLAGQLFSERYGAAKVQQGQPNGVVVAFDGRNPDGTRHEVFFGQAEPDFQMGFTNDITVGPVRLSSLLDWHKGGWVANLTNSYFDFNIPGGSLADTAVVAKRAAAFAAGHPVYLERGTFVKLREVSFSYIVPEQWSTAIFRGSAHDLRVELSGRNLKTWTRYSGYDPEVSNFGNQALGRFQDVTPYPPSRTFFLSLVGSF